MRMRYGSCDGDSDSVGVRTLCRRRNTSPYRTSPWYMIMPHALRSYLIMYYHYCVHSHLTRSLSSATSRTEVASVCPPLQIVCFLSKCIWMRESWSRIWILYVEWTYKSREKIKYGSEIQEGTKNKYKNLTHDNNTKLKFFVELNTEL